MTTRPQFRFSLLLIAALIALPAMVPAQSLLERLQQLEDEIEEGAAAATSSSSSALQYSLLDLTGMIDEKGVPSGFSLEAPNSLRSLLLKIRGLGEDEDVDGVVIRLDGLSAGSAKIQEIRTAIADLAEKKPVHLFTSTGSLGSLFLASAATDVTMPPTAHFFLNGLGADLVYMKRMLEKIGIEMQVVRAGAYKNAMETFTATEASPATEESMGAIIDTLFEEIIGGIADGRELSPATVEGLLTLGSMTVEEAADAELIDFVENEPEFYERIANDLEEEFVLVPAKMSEGPDFDTNNPFELFSMLMGVEDIEPVRENTLALVYLSGMIIDGPPEEGALEDEVISAYPIVDTLEKIRLEENIEAVVIRIDSGGGSALASDRIWSAIERLRAEKPVVASMSDVAASGGYYVAVGADEIWANPMTITGSIGVIGGKPVMKGLYDWIGLDFDEVERGREVNPFDTTREWTREEEKMLGEMIDDIYDTFIGRVAEARDVDVEKIREVAEGRVWSGRDAKEQGLVDELGGLLDSINRAKELAGLDPTDKYPLKIYPPKLSFAELLEKAFGGFGTSIQSRAGYSINASAAFGPLAPLAGLLPPDLIAHGQVLLDLMGQKRPVAMMPFYLKVRLD